MGGELFDSHETSEPIESIVIPRLEHPFGSHEPHPLADACHSQSLEWADRFGILGNRPFHTQRLGYLAAWARPDASPEELQITGDAIILLFASDGRYDGEFETPQLAVPELISPLRHVIEQDASVSEDPYALALLDIKQRAAGMAADPLIQLGRWAWAWNGYFDGVEAEAQYRQGARELDVGEYIAMREHTSAVYIVLSLVGLPDYCVPPEDWDKVWPLTQRGCQVVGLDNDLVSYDRERDESEAPPCNIITFLRQEEAGRSEQEAVDHAVHMHDTYLDEFIEAEHSLDPIDWPAEAYIQGIKHWIAGNLAFSNQSTRYGQYSEEE